MRATVISEVALEALRGVGDPDLDTAEVLTEADLEGVSAHGLSAVVATAGTGRDAWRASAPKVDLDLAKLAEAQRLFLRYPSEISGSLLLAALPQSYATAFGVEVLAANAELEHDAVRRIRRTARFLREVMTPAMSDDDQRRLWDPAFEPPEPGEPLRPWETCAVLRRRHVAVRDKLTAHRKAANEGTEPPVAGLASRRSRTVHNVPVALGPENEVPLNQEDLLAMQLTLSIAVFEVLERFGIAWSADEQEAYLHLWDVIGAHLGIGSPTAIRQMRQLVPRIRRFRAEVGEATRNRTTQPLRHAMTAYEPADLAAYYKPAIDISGWIGLRPPTIAATRILLDQLRERQWIDPGPTGPLDVDQWSSARSGRVLTKALLDELAAAMPRTLKLLPITVMRVLAPDIVRKRLSLGANGLIVGALVSLPGTTVLTERFTRVTKPNRVGSRMLREMANEVTVRASLRFLDSKDFVIPGLELGRR